jgi:rSAM/selenodomain-associated transferase 2
MVAISIIIPVLDDATALRQLLDDLDAIGHVDAERIVVDGGSSDGSVDIAEGRVDCVVRAPRGRSRQLTAGVAAATGSWLWLLHADTRVDAGMWQALQRAIAIPGAAWGRFDVRLDGDRFAFRLIETLMNVRSRWSGICTGDQGMFVRRDLLELVDGIPDQPLMEDIELSKRLRRYAKPVCLDTRLRASARRWEQHGIVATILLMWRLRLEYFVGVSPDVLARRYYGHES